MGKVVHSLHQAAANTQRNEKENARCKQHDIVARRQIQIAGYDGTAKNQKKTDACPIEPCPAMEKAVNADFGREQIVLRNKLRAQELERKRN